MFLSSTLMFYVFSMPTFANAIIYNLENARLNPSSCRETKHAPLVVLGGGIDFYVPSDSPYEILQPDSLIRTLRAPEFASDNTRYYLLGGGNDKRVLATIMKQLLISVGVDANSVIVETQSTSTHENALALTSLLPPSQTPTIDLLTSRLHVKRAAATFEKNGYQVCHIGVDTLYSVPKPPVSLLPYISGLQKSTLALREWMALLVYQFKGYV